MEVSRRGGGRREGRFFQGGLNPYFFFFYLLNSQQLLLTATRNQAQQSKLHVSNDQSLWVVALFHLFSLEPKKANRSINRSFLQLEVFPAQIASLTSRPA